MDIEPNQMRRYVEIKLVPESVPDEYNVFLTVGPQSFRITPEPMETREDAEWMASMLCIALARIKVTVR